jgi:hypothetical protein
MRPYQQPTTVAILGADTLAEYGLVLLLREEGYDARNLGAYPTGFRDELLDGVDVLLLAPGLKEGVREGFLEAMRSTPDTAAIPVLSLSAALKLALLDKPAQGVTWQSLFKELVRETEAASRRSVQARGQEKRANEVSTANGNNTQKL